MLLRPVRFCQCFAAQHGAGLAAAKPRRETHEAFDRSSTPLCGRARGAPSRSSGFPARALPSDSHQRGRLTVMSRDREGAGNRFFAADETGFARKGALQAVRLTRSREHAKGNAWGLLIAHQRHYADAPGGPPSRSSGFPARALPSNTPALPPRVATAPRSRRTPLQPPLNVARAFQPEPLLKHTSPAHQLSRLASQPRHASDARHTRPHST